MSEEDSPLIAERTLPWWVDVFLYPFSVSGLVHFAIFVLLLLLMELCVWICVKLVSVLCILRPLMFLFILLYYPYLLYYFVECVFHSSKGNRRAPEISWPEKFSWSDFFEPTRLLLGCLAICVGPMALYYGLKMQTDLWFWLLSGYGAFFLPMAILRCCLFRTYNYGLNPVRLIEAIIRTFIPYLGLVAFYSGMCAAAVFVVQTVPVWRIVKLSLVGVYLVFGLAHCLGSFYWRHKDSLDWGL